ncbi:HD-GYP domain-containing protein [Rhodoferax sp. BLA1]|uniref:HD-GYP domain-containing protein n=1 Tax=Rhodoferax sp. BLA1 TaxID=2576062 RepID=UPI0015D1C35A|nr:HD-GYP domain-containing protein [Rhodoferax sp. BLA1]
MEETLSESIDVAQLLPGMYIELEVGWLAHPFPTNQFKITSQKQIDTIRALGLQQVRINPAKSTLPGDPQTATVIPLRPARLDAQEQALRQLEAEQRRQQLATQEREQIACERRFGQTARQYKQALEQVHSNPREVMTQCRGMVDGFVTDMLSSGESAIRLLSDSMGDKLALHPVNVSVIALLLGKQLGLNASELSDLGLAAFFHDIGKSELPDRVRWLEDSFSAHEQKAYQEHVAHGVILGKRLELPPAALIAIAQHHEMADGSGFPKRILGESMSQLAKILALVNRYEGLCNPSRPAAALTPHEALALIFAQYRPRFDAAVLRAFIRMMGVYPPGSVVQLSDERFATVVSVNAARPLKPRIFVFDPRVPKHEALLLDLETMPDLGIKRSLKPGALPRAALDYLSPRQRICYFFERAVDTALEGPTP